MRNHSPPLSPPRCKQVPHTVTEHGETREDPYFWLKEKENPEVKAYLEKENVYCASVLKSVDDLKARFFEDLKGLMEKEIYDVPAKNGPWLYGSRTPEGMQYPILYRKKGMDALEEPLLDLNAIAKDHKYVSLGAYQIHDDHGLLAYSLDTEGGEEHRIHFKSLDGSPTPQETIEKTEGEIVFSRDRKALYYTRLNDQHRPFQVWRHLIGQDAAMDDLLYEETDPRFFVSIFESSDEERIFLRLASAESNEYRYAPRDSQFKEFTLFAPREPRHEYEVDSQSDRFVILSNREERNFFLYEAPLDSPKTWTALLKGDATTDLREYSVSKDHLAVIYGKAGTPSLKILKKSALGTPPDSVELDFPEAIREIAFSGNLEYARKTLRIKYSSPKTPQKTIEIDLESKKQSVLHQRKIENFDPNDYEVERIEVTSHDGTKVPVSLLYRKVDAGKALPTLLYGYGSYGMTTGTGFSITRIATVKQGFLYAIGHVRGSGDLGRRWYENGKFLTKMNTFLDFQACAKGLVAQGRTPAGEITIHGGSAGGLLVGATMNLDPSLFKGVIAEVPFVDVLSTMADESLPLTPIEWDEWGDPRKKEFFDAMKKYSPYDNLKKGEYPWILVNGGWNDPRVTYWEPAKFVARLRDLRTDDRLTLLDIEMGAGHFGVTGRYAALEKPAEILAFLYAIHFEPERLGR